MAYLKRFSSLIALAMFMATPAAGANFSHIRAAQVPPTFTPPVVIPVVPPVIPPTVPVVAPAPVAPVMVLPPTLPMNPGRPRSIIESPRLVVPVSTIFAS
ncbi:MAG: hypothetical protein JWN49_202 [Parcubacteria group bacterium]|nr:hypothetical protein [Parcubacteria group bacterium]